uniref:Uncharacterized protein n=1 Tax=Arundo donax TaxID=35708 RepID=A0A0A9FIW2_ARUDO
MSPTKNRNNHNNSKENKGLGPEIDLARVKLRNNLMPIWGRHNWWIEVKES